MNFIERLGVNSVNEQSGFNREALFKQSVNKEEQNDRMKFNEKTEFIQLIQKALLTASVFTVRTLVTQPCYSSGCVYDSYRLCTMI